MAYSLGRENETITFQSMATQIITYAINKDVLPGFSLEMLIPDGAMQNMAVNMLANVLAQKLGDEMNVQSQNTDSMGYAIARELGEQAANKNVVFNYTQGDDWVVGGTWWAGIIGSESSPGALSLMLAEVIEDVLEEIGVGEFVPTGPPEDDWSTGFDPSQLIHMPGMTVGPGPLTQVKPPSIIRAVDYGRKGITAGLPIPVLVGVGAAALILLGKKKKK